MSETIDKGAAMTALDIRDRLNALKGHLPKRAWVRLNVSAGDERADPVGVSCYPDDAVQAGTARHFYAATFEEALTQAEAWAATYEPIRRDATIRKLALDIIDLTDQHGSCTVAMLRGRNHPQADIDDYKDAACSRAGEMSGMAPFKVVS